MPRHYDDSQNSTSAKTRRQQEDQRRMAFRRAIETRFEDRRLSLEYDDYLEVSGTFWQSASASEGVRQSA
ncbi:MULTISPECIES: PA3496 family putative envelope integrity protein [unclassified Pseudomonas]|uniref:PA3496 family putative envelope integrity protein n=1 Tax=unclassified Pseudomonas TaxID=196821 RepID=UPI00384FB97E